MNTSPKAQRLTARQQQLLEFICSHVQANGYPPTLREIGEEMGISSTNGVNDHLSAIERKGYIQRDRGKKSRAIRVLVPAPAPALESASAP